LALVLACIDRLDDLNEHRENLGSASQFE
jgi:hypothetical protein